MIKFLLVLSLFVIGTQALIITLLVNMINKERKIKRIQIKQAKIIIKALNRLILEERDDKEGYKEAYEKCYIEYKTYFKETKILKHQLNKITDIHGNVVNNLFEFLKQGKIIKTKYLDNVIPYKFETMTKNEIEQFFGEAK